MSFLKVVPGKLPGSQGEATCQCGFLMWLYGSWLSWLYHSTVNELGSSGVVTSSSASYPCMESLVQPTLRLSRMSDTRQGECASGEGHT